MGEGSKRMLIIPVVVYTIEEGGVCGGGQQADADRSRGVHQSPPPGMIKK